jgi:GNAT superfamily N-acetyltransferase
VGRGAIGLELELTESTKLDPAASTFAVQQWLLYDEERHGSELARSWDESGLTITARREGAVVGTATGWTNLGVALLSELIVERTARREGIGAHLLAAFEAACRARGARRLALRTERDGPAQSFYERHGWHVETTISDWTFGVDVVQMRKDLTNA